ncbi:hypothetical protein TKK_0016665 [Trichogramma kaykai]
MTTQASNAQVVLAMATGCEKARPAVVDATAVTECLPDLCKYSNFHRIISVIYHFYRWHFRANKRAADGSKLLDADIWRKARWCCFKMIQAHHFKEEIQAIKNKKPITDSRYTRPDAKLIELPRDLEVEDYVRKFCLRKPLSQDSVETSN